MTSLFSSERTTPFLTRIVDVMDNHAYLVEGQKRALLVDACAGIGNIRDYVEGLTQLPVDVALTHGHYDHIGGALWFESPHLAEADWCDWGMAVSHATQIHEQILAEGKIDAQTPFAYADATVPEMTKIGEGDRFDLGGIIVSAVALPGHTKGSIGYLIEGEGILLSGDAVTPVMCLYFENSLAIAEWRDTLVKMLGMSFDSFYTGHHDHAFDKECLHSFIAAADYAEGDRGMEWEHARITSDRGIVHLCPCDTYDADSPDFRAVIEKWHELPKRKRGKRHQTEGSLA